MFSGERDSLQPSRAAPTRPPGPPATPAPASQPRHRPSVRVHRKDSAGSQATPQIGKLKKQEDENIYFRKQGLSQIPQMASNMNFLQTPAGGQARVVRQSYAGATNLFE